MKKTVATCQIDQRAMMKRWSVVAGDDDQRADVRCEPSPPPSSSFPCVSQLLLVRARKACVAAPRAQAAGAVRRQSCTCPCTLGVEEDD